MDKEHQDILKFTLREEIARIESHVSTLEAPTSTQARSLIARYGKLLLLNQRLMEALSLVSTPHSEEAASGVGAVRPMLSRRGSGAYVAAARNGFRRSPPEHL